MNTKDKCFHCGENIKNTTEFSILINNELRFMCCRGCLFVAKFIIDNKFDEFYIHRTDFSRTINNNINYVDSVFDDQNYQSKFVEKKNGFYSIVLAIDGITCIACTWLIEQHLKKKNGILDVFVNLTTCKAHILWDKSILKLSSIIIELNKLGYKATPYLYNDFEKSYKNEHRSELKKLIVAGIGMSQVMMLSASLYVGEGKDMHYLYWNFIRWINLFITTPVFFYSGLNIFFNAFNCFKNKVFGMNFTISLFLILSYIISIFNLINGNGDVYFDSICMFIFFLLVGRFLEVRARHHSNDIIYSLQELTLKKANLMKDGSITNIPVEDILKGDFLLIKSGDVVPVDCEIVNGISDFDESMLSGESLPVSRMKGENIIGGSINLTNDVVAKSMKSYNDSTINLIIKSLHTSLSIKPKIKFISDTIANFFIFLVLTLTFIVSLFWVIFSNINVINIVLSMLVITCPCALSLSVPVAMTNSINFLIKNGLLITKSDSLECMNSVTDIVFDKTGTITLNEFVLDKIKLNADLSIDFVFSIAALLEEKSSHPIAKAFYRSDLRDFNFNFNLTNLSNHLNNGIEGCINGNWYRIGKANFIDKWVKSFVKLEDKDFYVILSNDSIILAWFKFINPLRANINKCLQEIKSYNIKTHILSGDSSNNVDYIAHLLKIDFKCAGASVNDKIRYIQKLQEKKLFVMMIGDGLNDAPALSTSNISIAMGSGVDLAKINSDIVLLNNELLVIAKSIKHCRKLNNIIKQNIFWAIFYNVFGLFLAAMNLISPYYAAIGMSLSSLIVVLNSMRLNKR